MNRIILGNCLDTLVRLPDKSIDLLCTDPPYGIGISKRGRIGTGRLFTPKKWDSSVPPKAYFDEMRRLFDKHESVNHSKGEYARGKSSTNHVEGFFSIFKRGMIGTYQHCSEKHLQRYLHEFDFRYSNRVALGVDDSNRTTRAIAGANGKRLTYRGVNCGEAA